MATEGLGMRTGNADAATGTAPVRTRRAVMPTRGTGARTEGDPLRTEAVGLRTEATPVQRLRERDPQTTARRTAPRAGFSASPPRSPLSPSPAVARQRAAGTSGTRGAHSANVLCSEKAIIRPPSADGLWTYVVPKLGRVVGPVVDRTARIGHAGRDSRGHQDQKRHQNESFHRVISLKVPSARTFNSPPMRPMQPMQPMQPMRVRNAGREHIVQCEAAAQSSLP